MALIHKATINPTKLALLADWLPTRPWGAGRTLARQVGAYRFDDPAGDVGIETLLVEMDDGAVLQVPLTYRAAALPAAQAGLVGTAEHSVLGRRWVYDACIDPVWAIAMVTTVLTGGTQAEELVDTDGQLVPRETSATVRGSGAPGADVSPVEAVACRNDGDTTVVRAGPYDVVLARVVGASVTAAETLTGQWAGQESVVLAGVRTP